MTEVLDNLTTEGSDSDEIRKLFPKCKRKLTTSDVNLNKLSDRVIKHMSEVVADTTVPLPLNMNQQPSPPATSVENNNTVVVVPRCKPLFTPNRDRVDPWLNDSSPGPRSPQDPQGPQDEFKLRESRIEIAGGREVFSASRSRHCRKRFSDEILYHGGPAKSSLDRDVKRHSGEVLYDEDMSRYRMRSSAASCLRQLSAETQVEMTVAGLASRWFGSSQVSNSSDNAMTWTHDLLVDDGGEDMRPRPYTLLTQHCVENMGDGQRDKFVLKGQKSGTLIYETLVRGSSEVVFDDIGDCCDGDESGEGSKATTTTPSPLSTGQQQCHQQRNLSASTEAVNSEDFLSEREDAISSPEGAVTPPSLAFKHLDDDVDNDTEEKSEDETESQRTARLIGSLPIAQYEGSPRRYGPRPGHPRRVCQLETNLTEDSCGRHATFESNSNSKSKGHEQQQHTQSRGTSMKAFDEVPDVGDRQISPVSSSPPQSIEVSCEDQHHRFETINDDCSWRNLHMAMSLKLDDGSVLPPASNYDYLYEESETRKVLEEFYKQDGMMLAQLKESAALGESFRDLEYRLYRLHSGNSYVGRRLAQNCAEESEESPRKRPISDKFALLKGLGLLGLGPLQATQSQADVNGTDRSNEDNYRLTGLAAGSLHDALMASMLQYREMERMRIGLDPTAEDLNPENDLEETVSTNPDTEDPCVEADCGDADGDGEGVTRSRNFTLSPDTTECDSNDVESEVSVDNEGSLRSESHRYSSMPVLEDGLSSGHSSDAEGEGDSATRTQTSGGKEEMGDVGNPTILLMKKQICEIEKEIARRGTVPATSPQLHRPQRSLPLTSQAHRQATQALDYREVEEYLRQCDVPLPTTPSAPTQYRSVSAEDQDQDDDDDGHQEAADLESLDPLRRCSSGSPPPPPAPHPHRLSDAALVGREVVDEAIKEIKQAIKNTKSLSLKSPPREHPPTNEEKPIWVLRPTYVRKGGKDDEERKNDKHEDRGQDDDPDTDQETDRLLGKQRSEDGFFDKNWRSWSSKIMANHNSVTDGEEVDGEDCDAEDISCASASAPAANNSTCDSPKRRKDKDVPKKRGRSKEVLVHEPQVLIEGVLFRARYLGSTQLVCEGQPTKATRMMQAEEAVNRIKAPEGETQPSTEVDLFISTEKIMVLNTDLKEIMMDHALRTISYIADIGDLVVLMARRRMVGTQEDDDTKLKRAPKMVCHVFESEEAQFIAQSIGQAFQVAYMEFLKANGIEDHSFVKEMDYQEVLNSQEIYGDELEMFAKKEMQKEVIVPKLKGEMLGVVIVESGWGSMLPTVVIANLSPSGAAARCGQLNIGDQIIAVNGISLVGLPLSTCQNYIKNAKTQTVVKLTVVPCAPVVEVKIKRPDTKYQLGFSVQNGVICSLLRGGIAERGGVRVGHRIIEINGQSVVAVPHERIVNLLATSVGEIHMKTMPTSMFRLLTGQESPLYI